MAKYISYDPNIESKFVSLICENYHKINKLTPELEKNILSLFDLRYDFNITYCINNLFMCGYKSKIPLKEMFESEMNIQIDKMINVFLYKYFFHIQYEYHNKIILLLVNNMNMTFLNKTREILVRSLGKSYIKLKYQYLNNVIKISDIFTNFELPKNVFIKEIYDCFISIISKNDIDSLKNIFSNFIDTIMYNLVNDMVSNMNFIFFDNTYQINSMLKFSQYEYDKYLNIFNIFKIIDPTNNNFDSKYNDYFNFINNDLLNPKSIIYLINKEMNPIQIKSDDPLYIYKQKIYNSLLYISDPTNPTNSTNSTNTIIINSTKSISISDILNKSTDLNLNFAFFKNKKLINCMDRLIDPTVLTKSLENLLVKIFDSKPLIDNIDNNETDTLLALKCS